MKNLIIILGSIFFGLTTYSQTSKKNFLDHNFRLAIEGGYGDRTQSPDKDLFPEIREFSKGLFKGFSLNVQGSYFISKSIGLGVKFNQFNTSEADALIFEGDQTNSVYNVDENHKFFFVGPEFLYRFITTNEKHSFILTGSVGYLDSMYETSIRINDGQESIGKGTAATVGFDFGFQYDFHISPKIAIGTGINFLTGSTSELKVETLPEGTTETFDENEDLSKIGFHAGLRFYL